MSRVPVTVIGAGPYGLATAAHLKAHRVPLRILGEPMDGWRTRMPAGMFLKSTPRASNISAPADGHRLSDFRAARGRPPVGDLYPVPLAEFVEYGDWYQRRCVPEVERSTVTAVEYLRDGFRVTLDDGAVFGTRAVVVATGLAPYARMPTALAPLADLALASHTCEHTDMSVFAGQRVAVIGAGQSALEGAALLSEAGAVPTLVSRNEQVLFGTPPPTDLNGDRPLPARLVKPGSTLGPGWSHVAFSRTPQAFRHLPDGTRAHLVRAVLGPSGAWWLRDRVRGRIPLLAGYTVHHAEHAGGQIRLRLRGPNGSTDTLEADHVLAATGYRVDVDRLDLLDPALRRAVRRANGGAPRLSAGLESSVPGLYFTGLAAADTFGPVLRFVCGTGFAARRVSRAVATTPR
ncbi:NAD(P)-binding domain-containing protein [Kitasatospora sp. NPDC057015]|uniref:NAD(P)-binding domain-containing protein n=1 Tax=Kitasatospora sp. NPDC057015 TaxID=3346001 RepID=UPI0036393A2F